MKKSLSKKTILLIAAGAVVLAGAVFLAIFLLTPPKLTPQQETIVRYTRKLMNGMKSPDSFQLTGDEICYLKMAVDDEHNGEEYVYITYSAENSYGVRLKGTAVFIDGTYYDGNYEPEHGDYDGLGLAIRIEQAKQAVIGYQIMKRNGLDFSEYEMTDSISTSRVADLLHLKK